MYKYIYKDKEYMSWYQVRTLPDFKNVSFPKENLLTDELLAKFNIRREKYEPPKPDLDTVKAMKIEEMTQCKDTDEQNPIAIDNGNPKKLQIWVFDCDNISRSRISTAISALPDDETTRNWTLNDGTTIQVTKLDLQRVLNTWMDRSDKLHNYWKVVCAAVHECKTVEEVENIHWKYEEE